MATPETPQPRPKLLLIQLSGAPGSGKSTLSKSLALALNGIVIDHDLLKSFFLEQNHSFQESAKLSYSLQWVLAESFIQQGRTVFIDSACNYEQIITDGSELALRYGLEYKYIECRVEDISVLDARLRTRAAMRSQRTGVAEPPRDSDGGDGGHDYQKQFETWMSSPARPSTGVIVVDMTRSLADCTKFVLEQLYPSRHSTSTTKQKLSTTPT